MRAAFLFWVPFLCLFWASFWIPFRSQARTGGKRVGFNSLPSRPSGAALLGGKLAPKLDPFWAFLDGIELLTTVFLYHFGCVSPLWLVTRQNDLWNPVLLIRARRGFPHGAWRAHGRQG